MAGPLGCADTYTAALMDYTGSRQLGELMDVSAVTWERISDEVSAATVLIPYQGEDCCAQLADAWPWCNEIALYRDGGMVWQGPIRTMVHDVDDTLITARDVLGWTTRRILKALIDRSITGDGAADLAEIAQALIEDAFGVDDPGVLQHLLVSLSGIVGERRYEPNSGYVYAALAELGRTGIDYTTLGRRIIITGETPILTLPTLDDDHFVGALQVVKDGDLAVTSATVIGKGVLGQAGGRGECGLLEELATESDILDQASADAEAASLAAVGAFPVTLRVPDGAQLDPDAPVGINDLIPGALIPVRSSRTCYPLAADMRLQRLEVSFTAGEDGGGEQVKVTLVPPGLTGTSTD